MNCTPTTAILSVAVADTETFAPETVAPPAGAVRETVGGVVSAGGGCTVQLAYVYVPLKAPLVQERACEVQVLPCGTLCV